MKPILAALYYIVFMARCLFAALADWLDEEVDERAKRFSTQGRPGRGGNQHPPNRLPTGRS